MLDTEKIECEVGGVHNVVYKCPSYSEHIIRTRVQQRSEERDGRVFPYVALYLVTGDMLYPTHEGDDMVSRLIEELTRLDLVHDLLNARNPSVFSLNDCLHPRQHKKPKRRYSDNETLKVTTKGRKKLSITSLLMAILPISSSSSSSSSSASSSVYRPPANKGTTLVLVWTTLHRSTDLVLYGPGSVLKDLFPADSVTTCRTTYPDLDSQATPAKNDPHSVLAKLEAQHYAVIVRSSWVETDSGALKTQWLLHFRRGGGRLGHGGGTLRATLAPRSKSILTLASESPNKPAFTLKRVLSMLL
ncbi:uncharacterized protein LOC143019513 [Oratosquilla oratoria]|uniref:uncharacterized protein LOC143019489 n=1 Tax=Oratosquilla oratoria TaxID=337810 RepID=UPI003F7622B8